MWKRKEFNRRRKKKAHVRLSKLLAMITLWGVTWIATKGEKSKLWCDELSFKKCQSIDLKFLCTECRIMLLVQRHNEFVPKLRM
jgi:hypothetical protein